MTKRFRMAGRRFGSIKVCSSRNYSSKILVPFPSSFFVLLASYSFGSVVYAEASRELFSSVVFCPIIRSVPWFSADSVHSESDVL